MSESCGCGCKAGAVAGPGGSKLRVPRSEETVDTALERSPDAAAILRDLGIDTCCGGRLTLSQAAASAGVPVETLLEALAAGRGAAR